MAKFHGLVGFSKSVEQTSVITESVEDPAGSGIWVTREVETPNGVWTDQIITRPYNGDILVRGRKWQSDDKINDDLQITNKFSIIADSFMIDNLYAMKYVEYMGAKWKISDVSIERPRIIITLGGLYNG